ncbi:4-coumarate--CoA ligase-like 9, partial [Leptotrombidium deliense]
EVILFDGVQNDGDVNCIQSILRDENKALTEDEIFDQERVTAILQSRGTTGATKSAKLANFDLATPFSSSRPVDENIGNDEILLAASPISHLSGLTIHFYSLKHRTKLVTLPQNTLENNVNAIEKYKITRGLFSPSMMSQMSKCDPTHGYQSLKTVFVCGCRLANDVGEEFVTKFLNKNCLYNDRDSNVNNTWR